MSGRAAIYCRLSKTEDGSVEKVERQEKDCRRLAAQRGLTVTQVYVDNNVSAWQRKRRRPGWEKLLAGIEARQFDTVIVYHGDRLMRQPWDLERLMNLADQQGIRLLSPMGERDLDNPDDRFVLRIEVAQACRESDNTARRSSRGWAARAEQGAPRGNGVRAYGWERDGRTINRHEAAIIRRIARQLLEGRSYASIVAALNAAGEPTSTGKSWSISTLRSMMTNPRLIGKRTYRGEIVADGQWRPILKPDVFEAVQHITEAKRAAHPWAARTRARRYLLSGLARCGECTDAPMYVRTVAAGRSGSPAYTCTTCRKVTRAQPLVDEYVVEQLLIYLHSQPAWPTQTAVDDGQDEEIAALATRIDATLAEFADDDTVSPADLRKIIAPMKARLAALQRARSELLIQRSSSVLGRDEQMRARWEALSLADKRAIIADEVDVVISRSKTRGRTFDYSTVTVTPRGD